MMKRLPFSLTICKICILIKLMPKILNQKGAAHLLLPAVVVLIVAIFLVGANIKLSQKYLDNNVRGTLIAKDEGGSSGSGDHDSKSSDSSSSTSGSSGSETNIRHDRVEIKNKVEVENETEQENEDELEQEEENEGSAAAEVEELEHSLRPIAKFPLHIDLATNALIASTSAGVRVLTILPEVAVQNMLRAHLKKGLGPKFFGEATSSAEALAESLGVTILHDQIELEERGSQVVFKIPGQKHLKVLGFIPVTTNLTAFVSAETGNLLEEQESLLARVMDLLSP